MSELAKIEPKYESFLWRELIRIRDAEAVGDYMLACELTTSLIKFLPTQFKKDFGKQAESIKTALEIYSQNLKTHALTGQVVKHRKVQEFSRQLFSSFIEGLTDALDKSGYMERRRRFAKSRFEE